MKTTVAGFAKIQNSLNSCESSCESWTGEQLAINKTLARALRYKYIDQLAN